MTEPKFNEGDSVKYYGQIATVDLVDGLAYLLTTSRGARVRAFESELVRADDDESN